MKILWIDLNSSYAHSSLALPALHAQVKNNPEYEWATVSATINENVGKGQLENLTLGRMLLYIGFSIYIGISSEGTCNAAHIGGLLVGFVLAAILYRKKGNSGL